MDLNVRYLEYIMEVYRCSSINKAAKACYISQPHLSKIIKDMERELGFALMQRDHTGLSFTRDGLYFIDSVEKILREVKRIERIPQMPDDGAMHIVSSPSSIIIQAFLEYRRPFFGLQRDNEDIFKECGLQEIIQQVMMREAPLGIMVMFSGVAEKYKLLAKTYGLSLDMLKGDIPVYLVMSTQHPLADRPSLRIADLEQYPFVLDSHVDYDDTLAGALNIKQSSNVLYVSNRASRYDAVHSGYYICHASKLSLNFMDDESLCAKEIEDFHETLAVYTVKDVNRDYSVREREFMEILLKKI